jgi:hypothetical protein
LIIAVVRVLVESASEELRRFSVNLRIVKQAYKRLFYDLIQFGSLDLVRDFDIPQGSGDSVPLDSTA